MKYTHILFSGAILLSSLYMLIVPQQSAAKTAAKSSVEYKVVDSSIYPNANQFNKKISAKKIVWTGMNVILEADVVNKPDRASFEQNVIESITVTSGEQAYTINTEKFDDELMDIISMDVSRSKTWIAIHAERSAGKALILVNVKTGKLMVLNDRLQEERSQTIETIASFHWSPKRDEIAISFGNTEKSSLAIYDPTKDSFHFLPRTTNYISTNLVLWQKNGNTLDYISEYPSDQLILFRYNTKTNQVKPVQKINKQEWAQWYKLIH
ncbi:hypothetical protein [Paenibacillus sp. 7523-1]|uniref:hypothetical protein n=1 Tax=Paenibacillus sp. 7523-1 TaxID=2022550 RepID=UPI000BA681B9|nr:hypothetical protein [Paenibacillus sp. 7523-1]PAD32275.1 hypothetical protein CHH60_04665 [Paenibacillus sp. 7523-1]